ncbi:D-aminoacyl-tRNA deacylase [Flavobacteriaceae bacterium]|nr:D-aminoacyl-tRNA deacylase [Flavobacteriaceae bacterium]
MRLLIQKVKNAKVLVSGLEVGKISKGLLVFQAVEDLDNQKDIDWLVNKIINLRIFNDSNGVMNISVKETDGDILVVSQFTLMASIKKGNRPSYAKASDKNYAKIMYEKFIKDLSNSFEKKIECGVFRANMEVELVNDGPITILMDSKNKE